MRLLGRIVVGSLVVVLASSTLLGLSSGPSRGAPPDDEDARERKAFATRALAENCAICHSLDIVESQRLTSKQWQAEVEKMVGWGSPIAVEQRPLVIEFPRGRVSNRRSAHHASETDSLRGPGPDPAAPSRGRDAPG